MTRADHQDTLVIGGFPRVNLLPPEVQAQRHGRILRRRLGFGLLGIVVLTAGAVGAAAFGAMTANANLSSTQSMTQSLLAQQTEFLEVRQVQGDVAMIAEALKVGTSTEVNWREYLRGVQAVLPEAATITSIDVETGSPLAAYAQSLVPLEGPRIATLVFVATTTKAPPVADWLDALGDLPGFVDATPGAVSWNDEGFYEVTMSMHIGEAALAHRFDEGAN